MARIFIGERIHHKSWSGRGGSSKNWYDTSGSSRSWMEGYLTWHLWRTGPTWDYRNRIYCWLRVLPFLLNTESAELYLFATILSKIICQGSLSQGKNVWSRFCSHRKINIHDIIFFPFFLFFYFSFAIRFPFPIENLRQSLFSSSYWKVEKKRARV